MRDENIKYQLTQLARADSTCLDYLIPAGIEIPLNGTDPRDEARRHSIAERKASLARQISTVFNINPKELNASGKSVEVLFLLPRIYWLKSCRLKNAKAQPGTKKIKEENIRFFRSFKDPSQSNEEREKLYELIGNLPNELIDLIREFLNNYIDKVLLVGKQSGEKEYFWVDWVLEAFQQDFGRCKKFTEERFNPPQSESMLTSPSSLSL